MVSPPFTSHVRALSALAGVLIDRGHRVTWLAPRDVAALIDDERIEHALVGEQSHPAGSLDGVWRRAANPGGPLGLRRVIHDMSAATTMLCQEGRSVLAPLNVDCIIADQMEAAGGLLADALGVPFVSVACALPINREPRVPLPVMPWPLACDEGSLKRNEISARIYDVVMTPYRRTVENQARALGLSPRRGLEDCLSPLLQLSQTTASFDFPRQAPPAGFHHVGPLRKPLPARSELPWPLEGQGPVVFASLGTLQGGRFRLFARIATACRDAGLKVLVAHCGGLGPAQVRRLTSLGATWVTDFAPQEAVMKAAGVVVTHAGLNTVMDAFVAGLPTLALPITFDQPGVASRIRHAGAGLVASARWASAGRIRRALETLLSDPSFARASARLGQEALSAGGAPRAADLIEQTLSIGRSHRDRVAEPMST